MIHYVRHEPGVFSPLRDALLIRGDHHRHWADLPSYLGADAWLLTLYADPHAWVRTAILNVAGSARSSGDRTIAE